MHQLKRMSVYEEFCRKEHAILFATDIASRGLDFPAVDWVVQMDCPEDVNMYIHRAGRTARYQKGGSSLLMLLPSEEPFVEQMLQKKIPIVKDIVDPKKMVSIQRKLEAMLAKEVELKEMAQRAFVTYIKSVFLMKDKSVFDVKQIDLNAYSRSMGLAVAPRVRFLQRRQQQENNKKKKQAEESSSSATEEPNKEDSEPAEDWRKSDLKSTYDFNPEIEHVNENSDSDDDILTLKRKDHELLDGESNINEETGKKKKNKILTKEKVAKRILAKKIKANQKIVFDEEGNVIKFYFFLRMLRKIIFAFVFREYLTQRKKKFPKWDEPWNWKQQRLSMVESTLNRPRKHWKKKTSTTRKSSVNESRLNIVKNASKPKMNAGAPLVSRRIRITLKKPKAMRANMSRRVMKT